VPDDSTTLIGLIAVLLLGMTWHEAAHAWVADKLGDPTARSRGRVTMNPIKHIDPFLSILLPYLLYTFTGYMFGGAKPVPVNPGNFKPHRRARDFMFVALAGPGSNLLMAAGWGLLFVVTVWLGGVEQAPGIPNPYSGTMVSANPPGLDVEADSWIQVWAFLGVFINLLLAIFNMFPIPPLDGSRVIGWLLPTRLQMHWYRLDRVGFLVVIAFFLLLDGLQYVEMVLTPLYNAYDGAVDQLIALDPLDKLA
jgi:Zn-dependent protease